MFTKEIELTQHTPLIHFNASEVGASLRLSELKPKLDRYLEKVIGRDVILRDHIFWLNNYDFSKRGENLILYLNELDISFDYNVQFVETPRTINNAAGLLNIKNNKNSPFFGNIGDAGEQKYGLVQANSTVKINITSFHEGLLSYIEEHIHGFLAVTNFGTRQSKGFGSFSQCPPQKQLPFSFKIPLTDSRDRGTKEEILFNYINLFYKCLRSGINELKDGNNTFYFKSLLFMYAKDPANQWGVSMQWDKKIIKQHLFSNKQEEQEDSLYPMDKDAPLWYENKGKKLMLRDLLGLSSSEQWQSYNTTINKKVGNLLISRFKSPIIFKPYLSGDERSYQVYFGGLNENGLTNQEIIITNEAGPILHTPEGFNVNDYLTWVVEKKLNVFEHASKARKTGKKNEKLIEKFDHTSISKNNSGRILTSIFNSLSKIETTT